LVFNLVRRTFEKVFLHVDVSLKFAALDGITTWFRGHGEIGFVLDTSALGLSLLPLLDAHVILVAFLLDLLIEERYLGLLLRVHHH